MHRCNNMKSGELNIGIIPVGAVLLSVMVALLGTAICAGLVTRGTIHETGLDYAAKVILVLSSMAGSALVLKKGKGNHLQRNLIGCLIFGGILLLITTLFFKAQYQGVGLGILVIVAGWILPIILPKKSRKKGKRLRK